MHNGSDWNIEEITLSITVIEIYGSQRWSRRYKQRVSIPQLSDASFQIDLSDAKDTGSYKWELVEVRGYKDQL